MRPESISLAGTWLRATALAAAILTSIAKPVFAAGNDYCSLGERSSLFVVDRTTRFDKTDRDILVAASDAFFRNQAPGERVIVAAVSGEWTGMRLVFNECRPGCPDEGMLGRLVSACRGVIARADYKSFERRFIDVLLELLNQTEEATTSDLFRSMAEATRLIGASGYRPLRQVVFYSDLLEASPVLPAGQIRRLQPGEAVRRLEANHVEGHFGGADVRIVGFGREDGASRSPLPQDARHRVEGVWRGWLKKSGAGEVEVGLR